MLDHRSLALRLVVESAIYPIRATQDARRCACNLACGFPSPAEVAWPILTRPVRPWANVVTVTSGSWDLGSRRVAEGKLQRCNWPELQGIMESKAS